jgi:3-mercaptopyruvate sulfurtransferase SseA
MKRGYDRVGVIHGGFDKWVRLGLPTQPRPEEVRPAARESRAGTALAPDSSA